MRKSLMMLKGTNIKFLTARAFELQREICALFLFMTLSCKVLQRDWIFYI